MSIFYKLEIATYAVSVLAFSIQIILMYASIDGIKPTLVKMNDIAYGVAGVIITPDEFQAVIDHFEGVPNTFSTAMNINLFVYITGAALCNRFAFAKLTDQPFIFLEFYYLDALYVAIFSYVLSMHLSFYTKENIGLGLLPVPTKSLMYTHAYNDHNNSTDLNTNTFIGLMCGVGFARIIMSL